MLLWDSQHRSIMHDNNNTQWKKENKIILLLYSSQPIYEMKNITADTV